MKFLIVDDVADFREIVIYQLKQTFPDGEYTEAENGVQALDLYNYTCPDVVVTDRQMPLMGGEALAAALLTKDKDLPIFMVTGDRLGIKDHSLFWGVFSKGSTEDLGEVIRMRLEEKRKQAPRQGAMKTTGY